MSAQTAARANLRADPHRDTRRLWLYAAGLLMAYGASLVLLWSQGSARNIGLLMIAPTVGALIAAHWGPGVIQWGRPRWWLLAGLLPAVAALVAYLAGAVLGLDAVHFATLGKALATAPLVILVSMLGAVAEEIGWRGFLWPLLRRRWSFLRSSLVVWVVWWLYHAPLVILGWYGFRAGLPAFTVALVGMTLFVGVITDRSKSLWPSTIAHATWNALVLTGFAAGVGGNAHAFTGSHAVVGEFGWLAAIASLILGLAATWWHLRQAMPMPQHVPENLIATGA
jgi:membrane protease YdiL (CAAX protease family)